MNRSHKSFTKNIRYIVFILFIALIINIGISPNNQNTNEKIVTEQKENSIQSENKIEPSSNSNITAALQESEITIKPDEEAVVNYNIKANDVSYDGSYSTDFKDVVVLFDTSKSSENMQQFRNAIFNKLISVLDKEKTKYSIITYDKDASAKRIVDNSTYSARIQNESQDFKNKKSRYLLNEADNINDFVVKSINNSENNERNIGKALVEAGKVLNEEENPEINKYVLIISTSPVNYKKEDVEILKKHNANIITLNMSVNGDDASLMNLQKELSGEDAKLDDNYYCSKEKEHNDIQNTIMEKITQKIVGSSFRKDLTFNYIYLNFDLGNDLIAGDGLEKISDSENKYRYKIKDVYYKYDESSKKYKAYNKETNSYEDNFDVSFSVKINYDSKKNTYNFGQTNTISYTGLSGQVNDSIDTSAIKIQPIFSKLNHGVYKGITKNSDNEYEIEENDNKIMKNGTAKMYASTKIYGSTNFVLSIDENAELDGEIEGYKIQNGTLSSVKVDVKKQNNNIYNINITDNNVSNYDDVVILYNCREKSSNTKEKLTNNIKYGDKEKDADLIIQSLKEYPDLF